jgi:hypothetical protein
MSQRDFLKEVGVRKIIGPDVSFFTRGNMCNTIPGDRKMVFKGRKTAGLDVKQRQPRTAMEVNPKDWGFD